MSPTWSAVVKYASRLTVLSTGFCRALTAAEISAVVFGKSMVATALSHTAFIMSPPCCLLASPHLLLLFFTLLSSTHARGG
jgi:hypothetical protein